MVLHEPCLFGPRDRPYDRQEIRGPHKPIVQGHSRQIAIVLELGFKLSVEMDVEFYIFRLQLGNARGGASAKCKERSGAVHALANLSRVLQNAFAAQMSSQSVVRLAVGPYPLQGGLQFAGADIVELDTQITLKCRVLIKYRFAEIGDERRYDIECQLIV